MRNTFFLVLSLSLLISCGTRQSGHRDDLDFIYKTIVENHPGVYNDQDPEFNKNCREAYAHAKKKIMDTYDAYVQKEAISEFAKSFQDAHLRVQWKNDVKKTEVETKDTIRNDDIRKFALSHISKDIVWISLPTFDITIQQKKDFDALIKAVSTVRSEKYIIFDVRGNRGGNSECGSKVIDALFGEEYANQQRCLFNKHVYIDWRASKGNVDYIASFFALHPSKWLQEIEHGLKESFKCGKHYYRESLLQECSLKDDERKAPLFEGKVMVIIDSVNVSAALDFIDELKMVAINTVLIGQTTKADRLYMDARSQLLPSGFGSFYFPIKVYRNRPRLDNQPYTPDIPYQDVNHTSVLQNFIFTKIAEGSV